MKTGKTLQKRLPRKNWLWLAAIVMTLLSSKLQALTIISDPDFTPSVKAPLAGVLTVQTDVNSFVSVSVNDGTNTWTHDFYDFGANHAETLLGFKPNRSNQITVTVRDQFRNTYTSGKRPTFVTSPLPAFMPPIILVTNNPSMMEPGYTIFRVNNQTNGTSAVTIVDYSGQVVWFAQSTVTGGGMGPVPTPSDIRQLPNGMLFFPETSQGGFGESDMLGNSAVAFGAAPLYPVDEHEDLLTDHGTILYLSVAKEDVENFPSNSTDPNAPKETADVDIGRVVEVSTTNSAVFNAWSLINMLDPVRIDYLCFALPSAFGIDPEHANAIVDSTSDNSIIVSMRNQDAIVKFSRSGQIKWILGPHENWSSQFQQYLLTPVGTPFTWNYGQHAPILTPQGTLLFFDDGNCRAEPFDTPLPDQDNYSRAAEFSVDETNMTVSQVWEFTGTNSPGGYSDRLYCGLVGNASWLPQTGNVLVTY
jgi:arylsulfate sulfotransferase